MIDFHITMVFYSFSELLDTALRPAPTQWATANPNRV